MPLQAAPVAPQISLPQYTEPQPELTARPREEAIVEEAPVGPSPEEEAEFLAGEQRTSGDSSLPSAASAATPKSPQRPLPSLDALLGKIPASTRAALEQSLNARITRTRRLSEGELR